MENRDRILQAAARVYAEAGFRGATTRRIAQEAGVNEVTLFRIFGSKDALLLEAMNLGSGGSAVPALPELPLDPESELASWCEAHLARLREAAPLILQMMGDTHERPELGGCASESQRCATRELREYADRLHEHGIALAEPAERRAAASMLNSALHGDAMARGLAPEDFPHPAEAAPRLYARLFLRALRAEPAAARASQPRSAKKRAS